MFSPIPNGGPHNPFAIPTNTHGGVCPPGLRNEMNAYQTDCGPIRGSIGSRESSFMRLEHEPYSGVGMTCKGRGPRRNGRNQEKHLKPLALNYWVGP